MKREDLQGAQSYKSCGGKRGKTEKKGDIKGEKRPATSN